MMDGKTETCRVLFQNKINLRYCASGWFYYRNIATEYYSYPIRSSSLLLNVEYWW